MAEPAKSSSDNSQAAAERHQIFEQIALERLRSGSDISKPVSFLPLSVRLTAVAAASVTGIGVLWACLAQVPVQVSGIGSIVPPQISSAIARTDGILLYQVSGVGPDRLSSSERRNNAALREFWREAVVNPTTTLDFKRLNQISLAAMMPSEGQVLVMPESLSSRSVDRLEAIDDKFTGLRYEGSTMIARITNDAAIDQLDGIRRITSPKLKIDQSMVASRRLRSVDYAKVNTLLRYQQKRTEQELVEREELFKRLQTLWKQGFVSTTQLLSEQAQINSLRNQLLQVNREQLNSQFDSSEQNLQAEQTSLNSVQTENQLQAALSSYMSRVYLITPPAGAYIVTRTIRNGMEVSTGHEVFTYSIDRPTLPRIIPVFVDAATSQQIAEGMKVLLTPRGISRAQFGGIPGVVEEVGRLPLPSEGLASYAGSRSLGASIQKQIGTAYLVQVKVEQKEPAYCQQMLSLRCYQWSTNRRPPFPVRIGTLADVQIKTQYSRPIEFVMPALRQILGLVVDNR